MSRPYTEVVLHDQRYLSDGKFSLNSSYPFNLKTNSLHVMWRGSIADFISDFGLPSDSILSSKKAGVDGVFQIKNWVATLNFKFNYEIWFKDPSTNYYVLGSNNTVNLTCPNFLLFDGTKNSNIGILYNGSTNRPYNPNIYPLNISISSFIVSNKSNDFQTITGSGTNSQCYLIFRYGLGGYDIQICLQTRDSGAFQVNSSPLIIPYASLTFTGFNKTKKVDRV